MTTKVACKVRNWDDQPEFLEHGRHAASFWVSDDRSGQVIQHGGKYYISIGNLFGSQTVRVPTADEALQVIDWVNKCGYEKRAEKRTPAIAGVKKDHPTWEFLVDGAWK